MNVTIHIVPFTLVPNHYRWFLYRYEIMYTVGSTDLISKELRTVQMLQTPVQSLSPLDIKTAMQITRKQIRVT